MTDEDDFEDDDQFPWEDVEAARKNQRLQREHPAAEGQERYTASAKSCPQCHAAAGQLSWFYFESPTSFFSRRGLVWATNQGSSDTGLQRSGEGP